ncbi:MAG: 30S ribosomal protein S12 methylthiotransferase RimO [Clostridia bacterium]|nr:30S ribosomal protein S12 methylthiotransferase RimO [Clostridia bacterium]
MGFKVGMLSLGCPKNQVDAELMLAELSAGGYEITSDENDADAVIINTCGFIESAKKESIDAILDVAALKGIGRLKALIVTGCLAERYIADFPAELPEVDAVVGIGANGRICEIVSSAIEKNGGVQTAFAADKNELVMDGERVIANDPWYAYLRVADGCDNCCTYCAIPMIRGRYRSRSQENVVAEARALAAKGVKELVIVAQDVTRYGEDLYGESRLPELLSELCTVEGICWIRLLYTYPDKITDRLLDVMAKEKKILPYLDVPLQHCNGDVLKRMNRTGDRESLTSLISRIREKLPEVTLRTTFITGFPGETEENFEELCEFISEIRFDRLGAFAYSAEEGTVAAGMADQVDETVRTERMERVMELQSVIASRLNDEKIGSITEVITEGYDDYVKYWFGRSVADAPDIDCKVFFKTTKKIAPGDIIKVEISDVMDYDLIGEAVRPD